MKAALVSRVAPGHAAFSSARQGRQQRQRPARLAVAAVEEPETVASSSDAPLDLAAAYQKFEELLDGASFTYSEGDTVVGTVFRVDQRGAYVDVGGKSTAFCPLNELSLAPVNKVTEVVAPNTRREFVVVREETGRSDLTVSLRRPQLALAWQRLRQTQAEDAVLRGRVAAVNRGGLLVELEGVRGFCPGSQLAQKVAAFDELLGKELPFKVTEVDEDKARLLLSNRGAATDERIAAVRVGEVAEGVVTSVQPYGAFVDINGVAGLLHISQISHDRITNVDKVLSEGDRIKVLVLSQDRERGRVALCTKKLEPTPGDMLRDPALVYEKAEEMAALFRQRVAEAEAAAREGLGLAPEGAAPAADA